MDKNSFEIYGKGPFVSLKKINDNSTMISKIPNASIYKKDSIPDNFHFVNENSLDYLILSDNGYMINPNDKIIKKLPVVGMHGYSPEIINMHGIFYAYGTKIKKNLKIDSFEVIDIYPLMCAILNIPEYHDIDGDLKNVENILK